MASIADALAGLALCSLVGAALPACGPTSWTRCAPLRCWPRS
ncbi:MAG: hypothetical protein U0325_19515 [Polyangiales bacterium]